MIVSAHFQADIASRHPSSRETRGKRTKKKKKGGKGSVSLFPPHDRLQKTRKAPDIVAWVMHEMGEQIEWVLYIACVFYRMGVTHVRLGVRRVY
jgi:hypothetical protein